MGLLELLLNLFWFKHQKNVFWIVCCSDALCRDVNLVGKGNPQKDILENLLENLLENPIEDPQKDPIENPLGNPTENLQEKSVNK